jgi:plasmid stability protein
MAQILVRALKPEVVRKLKERAKRNERSLEAEVRVILQDATRYERDERAFREAVRFADRMRESLRGTITGDSTDLIREDRDSR